MTKGPKLYPFQAAMVEAIKEQLNSGERFSFEQGAHRSGKMAKTRHMIRDSMERLKPGQSLMILHAKPGGGLDHTTITRNAEETKCLPSPKK